MFRTYRLDHPHVDESKDFDAWSYLWASLFGPLYVLYHRFFGLALLMLLFSAMIAAVGAGFLVYVLVFFDTVAVRTTAIVVVPIIALIIQGLVTIEVVVVGYMRRGWHEGY